jgi:riboflavin kinase/FMN adenylyltransferase
VSRDKYSAPDTESLGAGNIRVSGLSEAVGNLPSVSIWRAVPGAATEPRAEPAVVTIGNFDGVHRGHQQLLIRAATAGQPVVAVTFDPHPAQLFAPEKTPKLLCSLARRLELLEQHGADEVRVLHFTREIAALSPEEFIDQVLVHQLRAAAVVVGENFRFGARAAGDVDLLRSAGVSRGFSVEGIALVRESDVLCSTLARDLIAAGDLRAAAVVLGRPHEVAGTVRRGDGRGKDLGFPTANVPVDETYAVPPDGVYAGYVNVDGQRHQAAISVGTNPTFGGVERRVESYVLDAPGGIDLYDREIRVEFIQRLRGMEAFDTVEALVAQMHEDVAEAREILA